MSRWWYYELSPVNEPINQWLRFVIAALATWRVTHLIVYEDGPWEAIARLRKLAGSRFFGKLMDCFYCLSLWVSAAATFTLTFRLKEWIMFWLALSGAACLLDGLGQKPVIIQGGTEDAVLRTEPGENSTTNSASGETEIGNSSAGGQASRG
jgi:hypothetical protein